MGAFIGFALLLFFLGFFYPVLWVIEGFIFFIFKYGLSNIITLIIACVSLIFMSAFVLILYDSIKFKTKPKSKENFYSSIFGLLIIGVLSFQKIGEAYNILFPTVITPEIEKSEVKEEQKITVDTEWRTIDTYQVKNGLVEDTKTGLMWMRCGIGQHWNGATCAGKVETYSWTNALKVPNNFNFDGYSDWRVPTREELITLIYCSNGKYEDGERCHALNDEPTLFSNVFPNTDPRIYFWTSERDSNNVGYAWMVDFYFGMNQIDNGYNAVRLVRIYRK